MVPHDYATFMQIIGGGWKWLHRLDWCLFDAQSVAKATSNDVEMWLEEKQHEHALGDRGLWLRIGSWSDKHDYLLCCDRELKQAAQQGAAADGARDRALTVCRLRRR